MMETQHQAAGVEIPTFVPAHMKNGDRVGKKPSVSPRNGVPTPPGRPPGVKNKLTSIRDAVIEAFDKVGGAEYLVKLAEGTQSDRAAFASLVAKVLPTQIQANVDGGIRLELGWLSQRQVGTPGAQIPQQQTQVLDMQREKDGTYRIIDQHTKVDMLVERGAGAGEARDSAPPTPLAADGGGGA